MLCVNVNTTQDHYCLDIIFTELHVVLFLYVFRVLCTRENLLGHKPWCPESKDYGSMLGIVGEDLRRHLIGVRK